MNNKTKLSFFACLLFGGIGLTLIGCSTDDKSTSSVSSEPSSSEVSSIDTSSSSSSEGHVHEYLHFDAVSPTCTQAGNIEYYKCNGCNKYFNADKGEINESAIAVAALGHDYGAWTVTKSATCTEGGTEQRVCSRDATHIETRSTSALNHNYGNWEIVDEPSCTETGLRRRVCSHDASHVETEVLEKLPHTPAPFVMENVTPSGCTTSGSYEKVVYCSVCHEELSRNNVVTNPINHDYGEWEPTTAPTCTEAGESTRVCANDSSHTETKPIAALGHDLIVDTEKKFTWDPNGKSAVVNLKCSRSGCTHTETTPANMTHETTQYKNCIQGEKITYTARYTDKNNVEHVDTNVIDGEVATGHNYQFIRFDNWDYVNETVTVIRTCSNDVNHQDNIVLTLGHGLTKSSTPATCTEAEKITYTATYETHEAEQTIDGEAAHGHNYQYVENESTFRWNDDHSKAWIKYICSYDNKHFEEREAEVTSKFFNATCSAHDHTTYTARYTDPETSIVYEDEQTIIDSTTPLGDHNYTFDSFEWNEQKTSALAVLKCSIDDEHPIQKVAAQMSSAQQSAATCTAKEVIRYTATYGSESEYYDVQVGEPLGHHLVQVGDHFDWNEEYTNATVHLACDRDGCEYVENHDVSNGVVVTSNVINDTATCMAGRKVEYTATYSTFSDTNTYIGEPLAHNYEFSRFVWADNYETCQVELICHNGDDHITYQDLDVVVNETAPTCLTDGYTTYSVSYLTYNDSKVKAGDAALGHHAGEAHNENVVEATCSKAGSHDVVIRCDRDGCNAIISSNHVVDPVLEHSYGGWVGSEPTCTTDGVKTRECEHCHHEEEQITSALGHDYSVFVSKVNPTCTTQGYDIYKCSRCSETLNKNYVSELGHTPDREHATCLEDKTCTICHAVLEEALGHDFVLKSSTAATCTEAGTAHYECSRCEATKDEVPQTALGHSFDDEHVQERLQEGKTSCYYDKWYQCTRDGCDHEEVRGHVEHHTYVATVVTEANCKNAGVKRYTCTQCGKTYDDDIAIDPNNHIWTLGTVDTVTGERVDTCNVEDSEHHKCGATRTVKVFASTNTSGATAESLKGEVALSNSTLKIDSAIIDAIKSDAADENVKLNVGVSELSATDKQAAINSTGEAAAQVASQIGDNPIYDFSMTYGSDTKVTNFGENNFVTVTLPYELGTDENVDDIAVWFISDSGKLESIKAEYSNGFITFKTNHFSYYTVTRLTPSERCALYGHSDVVTHIDGDCTHGAYDILTCVRCHRKEIANAQEAPGHTFNVTTVPATCLEDGLETGVCSVCGYTYKHVIKAAGSHHYVLDEEHSTSPTCTTSGVNKYICSVCGNEYEEVIAAYGHDYENVVTPATCTTNGYTTHTCSRCGDSYRDTYVDAFDHDYGEWEVTTPATCTSAGVETRVCDHDANHTETRVIQPLGHVAGEAKQENYVAATCETAGGYDLVVRCTREGCTEDGKGAIISSQHVVIPATGHEFSDEDWHRIGDSTCTEPGIIQRECHHDASHIEQQFENPTGHTPGEAKLEIIKAPTCTEAGSGYEVIKCTKCNTELSRVEVVVPATGHTYGEWEVTTKPTCTTAGEETRECKNCDASETRPVDALGHSAGATIKDYESEGHSHASCTENGSYDEVIKCDICGEELSRTPRTELATGHDYVATFRWSEDHSSAIVIFTCKNDASHVVTKDANVKITSLPPTCSEERDVTYYASITFNGTLYEDTVIVEDVILEHVHGGEVIENKVNPTCTEAGGYDAVIYCSRCGEQLSSKHVTVDALGHTGGTAVKENYIPASCSQEGGYDMVTYCTVCDAEVGRVHSHLDKLEHTPGGAVIENDVPATCQEEGSYDEVIYCSVCGEKLSTTEHVHEKLNHNTGELQHDERAHYYVCADCEEKVNEQEHNYEKEIVKPATCVEGGIVRFTCTDCGYTFESKIGKTGEHTYENGVCTVCGRKEGECDHKSFVNREIDLAELGFCGGTLKYQTCECGEVIRITEEGLDVGCDMRNFEHDQYTEVIDGVSYQVQEVHCNDCGWGYKGIMLDYSYDSCSSHMKMDISFPGKDGVPYLSGIYEYTSIHHSNKRTYTEEIGECGTIVSYEKCTSCGEILDIDIYENHCHFTTASETEDVSDVCTITRTIKTCKDCGLRITYEEEREALQTCITEVTTRAILEDLNEADEYEVVYEAGNTETIDGHNWKYTYELVGDSCKDGVNMYRHCDICDTTQRGYSEYHRETSESILNFSEYGNGKCNSKLVYRVCDLCHHTEYVDYYSLVRSHPFTIDRSKEGTETHQYLVCPDCGVKLEVESRVEEKQCSVDYYSDFTFYDDDDTLIIKFDNVHTNHTESHNYEYTNVTFNNPKLGCEGGVSYTKRCTKCGEGYSTTSQYHDIDKEHIENINILDENGNLLVSGRFGTCNICHHKDAQDLNINHGAFDSKDCTRVIDGREYYGTLFTKEGIDISYSQLRCQFEEGCYIYDNYYYELIYNGETLYTGMDSFKKENHNYIYDIEFIDPEKGCEGGYVGTARCETCGEVENIDGSGHRRKEEVIKLAQYGACKNVGIEISECEICHDQSIYISGRYECDLETISDTSVEGHTHVVERCRKCGITYTRDVVTTVVDTCHTSEVTKETIEIGDFSRTFTTTENYVHHDIDYTYTSLGECNKDGIRITGSCANCDYSIDEVRYDHVYKDEDINLQEWGACDGTGFIHSEECLGCHTSNVIDYNLNEYNHKNLVTNSTETVNDFGQKVITTISTCSDCNYYHRSVQTLIPIKDKGIQCYYDVLYNEYIKVGEHEISFTRERYGYEIHNEKVTYTYLTENERCREGVRITRECLDCNKVLESRETYNHSSRSYTENLSKYGINNAYINHSVCEVCKEDIYDYFNDGDLHYVRGNDYVDQGKKMHVDIYALEDEETLTLQRTYWDEDIDPCHYVRHYHFYIYSGTRLLTEYGDYISEQENHLTIYTYDETENCEDGYHYQATCAKCHKVINEGYSDYHSQNLVAYLDLSEYGSTCGGYVMVYECACGKQGYVNTSNFECDFGSPDRTDKKEDQLEEDQVFEYTNVYTCAATDPECSFKYSVTYEGRYVSDDDCAYTTYTTYRFGISEEHPEGLYSKTVKNSNVYYRHNNNDKPVVTHKDDGNGGEITTETYTCDRCGKSNVYVTYKDANEFVYKYDETHNLDNSYHRTIKEYEPFYYDNEPYSITVKEINYYGNNYDVTEYSYTDDDPCHYVAKVSYYDEAGNITDVDTYNGSEHLWWSYYQSNATSCSQDYVYGYYCPICHEHEGEYKHALDHDFIYDSDKGLYVCSRCGLESVKGVSGSIILEDLSDSENYVVGYSIQNQVRYSKFITITYTENDEVKTHTLNEQDIEMYHSDSPRSYSFSKAGIAYWVDQLKIVGDYSVTFTFVPYDASGDFDYSLTF